jgi:hypothetical protein
MRADPASRLKKGAAHYSAFSSLSLFVGSATRVAFWWKGDVVSGEGLARRDGRAAAWVCDDDACEFSPVVLRCSRRVLDLLGGLAVSLTELSAADGDYDFGCRAPNDLALGGVL